MSNPILSDTSQPVPPTGGAAAKTPASAPDSTTAADTIEAVPPAPVLANFTPLPSVHGVTYSMI